MLHAVPDVLNTLEARLLAGEDPLLLLASVRWSDLVGWPDTPEDLKALQQRVASIQALVNGLQAPLRATLMGLQGEGCYNKDGSLIQGTEAAPYAQKSA